VSDPYVGEIQAFPFPFATGGFNTAWLPCFGQLVAIQQFTALFSLIGTLYGGNGTTNFALPNLSGAITNSQGTGPGLQPREIGDMIGSAGVTLTTLEMPIHKHGFQMGSKLARDAAPGPGTTGSMAVIDPSFTGFVAPPSNTTLSPNAMALTGNSQAHPNSQPTQAIVWCIAYQGIYPSFG
jgi:microcystin-dependent protein